EYFCWLYYNGAGLF
nr:immunoglobulin light chain junction region [Macaca mulatta]MOW01988.1 immunoglobulin light chain junction region [Macaca mulatta]